jgi:hypothetical protein
MGAGYHLHFLAALGAKKETRFSLKFRVFWDTLQYSQIDVDIDLTTRQYIAEDSELHTRRRENLKSHCFSLYGMLVGP